MDKNQKQNTRIFAIRQNSESRVNECMDWQFRNSCVHRHREKNSQNQKNDCLTLFFFFINAVESVLFSFPTHFITSSLTDSMAPLISSLTSPILVFSWSLSGTGYFLQVATLGPEKKTSRIGKKREDHKLFETFLK